MMMIGSYDLENETHAKWPPFGFDDVGDDAVDDLDPHFA